MTDLFSDDVRRNPYPVYEYVRGVCPVFRIPPPFDAWGIFDYEDVKRALDDPQVFSSAVPAPRNWFLFHDPPQHTKLRALIMRAFTPRVIAALEPRIAALSRELLRPALERGQIDLATEYSVPLAMKVISGLIGIPDEDWLTFRRWSDVVLTLSYARSGGIEAQKVRGDFAAVTEEMSRYVAEMIRLRRESPRDDLITRLVQAEVDGDRLTHDQVLGFFQLLVVGGQETTANLINNAIVCFLEHPDQLERLRASPQLLTGAIEEVLRYRSPIQWLMRTPRRDVQMHGQTIPAGKLVLIMLGSANRDAKQFPQPDRFDIARQPNAHVAFGHGIHFCLGAALSRLEARIALSDLLGHVSHFEPLDDHPWPPRRALHVHGPEHLPLRVKAEQDRA